MPLRFSYFGCIQVWMVLAVDIAFSTQGLRSLCQSEETAKKKFGELAARMLIARLADIRAAKNVGDLAAVCALILDDGTAQIEMPVGGEVKLIATLRANHPECPKLKNGLVDWAHVTRVFLSKVGEGA
jgi:hypothetical protein